LDRQHQAWSHRFPVLAHNTTPPGGKNMLHTMNITCCNRPFTYHSYDMPMQKHLNALDVQIQNLTCFTEQNLMQEQQMRNLNFPCDVQQS